MVIKRDTIRRQAFEKVTQALKLGDSVKYNEFREKTFHKRWITEQYGKVKNVMGKQIGGEMPGSGGDVIKHIKKYDPQNSSGAFKEALNIMEKLQKSTMTKDLMNSIQPLQNILGGKLYGAMQSAGSMSKSMQKAKKQKKQPEPEEEVEEEDDLVIAELIAAAMAMINDEEREEAAENMNYVEFQNISDAYYNNRVYSSATMPKAFVDAINKLMPIFRATKGIRPSIPMV